MTIHRQTVVRTILGFALIGGLACSTLAIAEATGALQLPFKYASYKSAQHAGSFIHFRMVHRKLGGHMASNIDGVVKAFSVTGHLEKEILDHAAVSFRVQDMDTDNGTRDHKMTTDSLKSSSHPMIRVIFNKPLNLGSQTVPGTMEILGNKKPVTLPITIKKTGTTYQANGKTTVTFSGLGVPKPGFISDAIASVDDAITITYQIVANEDQF
ncbi:MAG: YceI family protein [Cyanobacteria bacterium HKST-UBA04]|nr:YceI family protein [Cyanobacteria bacterium HKST-UBA04]